MTDGVNVRDLALDLLIQILEKGAYSHLALSAVLEKYQYLEKKERAFLTRLVEGTLERKIQIDYIIGQYSKTPVRKMKPLIRNLLRSSVYQICFMDGVPDAAVCNEAVKTAGKRKFYNLKGFVNGVLRNICRNKDKLSYPQVAQEPEKYFSVKYSMPEWMVQLWKEDFQFAWNKRQDVEKMQDLLQAFLEPAPVTIRTNLARTSPEELQKKLEAEGVTVEGTDLSYAFAIKDFDHLTSLSCFQEGLFYIQDLASMMAVEAAGPKGGDFVLDVCAAPGGKAIHAAELMGTSGQVLARDLTDYKLDLIRENIDRCQLANINAQVWDATVPDPAMHQRADLVLADLPCSGLGVLRRKKDIKDKMTLDQTEDLADLQRRILSVVQDYVRPGGRLLYSTCTIHRAENQDNAAWFLKTFPCFVLKTSQLALPGRNGGDGFYYALFERV